MPGRRQGVPHGTAAALERGESATGGRGGQHRRDVLQSLQAKHLLDQIRGQGQVGAPCRGGHLQQHRVIAGDGAPDLLQTAARGPRRIPDPRHPRGALGIERDRRHHGRRADVRERGLHGATRDLGEQGGRAVQRRDRRGGVDPTLVTLARLAGELVAADGPEHREGVPHGGLEQDVGRVVGDLRARTAHDARQRDRAAVVADDDVLGIERALDVVEGGERLPRACPADGQPALQASGVERVHRVPQLEHDVVGDVDGRGDRAHAREQQAARHPPRGPRGRVDSRDPAQGEPLRTGLGGNLERPGLLLRRQPELGRGVGEVQVEPARQLAGQAAGRQAVAPIRRHVELDHGVPLAGAGREHRCGGVPGLCGALGEDDDPAVVGADPQLGGRTDHALTRLAVGLALADLEPARQDGAR